MWEVTEEISLLDIHPAVAVGTKTPGPKEAKQQQRESTTPKMPLGQVV